jgi:hypothetical protein
MTRSQIFSAAVLTFSGLVASEYPGHAQKLGSGDSTVAACDVQFRRCWNRCDRVYESHRAIGTCRHRCQDDNSGCESR